MNYIVLDMEWNHPGYNAGIIRYPVALHGEIIQIGAVKLDEDFNEIDNFELLVSPVFYKKMNSKVKRLTSIEDSDLMRGYPFREAIGYFSQWCGDDFVFLTWGPDDEAMLRENLKMFDMSAKWIPQCYDIQCIFNYQFVQSKDQVSLSSAIERFGIIPLHAHNALNDAINTVAVCRHIDLKTGISEYEKILSAKRPIEDPLALAVILSDKVYSSFEEALETHELRTFECPECGGMLICNGYEMQNCIKAVSVGVDENGEEYFVRFKCIGLDDGVKVKRIIYCMDDAHRQYYNRVCKRNEEKRRAKEQETVSYS